MFPQEQNRRVVVPLASSSSIFVQSLQGHIEQVKKNSNRWDQLSAFLLSLCSTVNLFHVFIALYSVSGIEYIQGTWPEPLQSIQVVVNTLLQPVWATAAVYFGLATTTTRYIVKANSSHSYQYLCVNTGGLALLVYAQGCLKIDIAVSQCFVVTFLGASGALPAVCTVCCEWSQTCMESNIPNKHGYHNNPENLAFTEG